MVSREEAYDVIQNGFYGGIDRGDMEAAVDAFHDDVVMTHTQVWEHGDHTRSEEGTKVMRSKDEILTHLTEQSEGLDRNEIEHDVKELIVDGDRCAFLGDVIAPDDELPYIGWFELEDGKITRLIITPTDVNR